MKQRVYVETSIISYLVSRPSSDVRVAASQLITREWWEERSGRDDLFISEFVLAEASLGNPEAARSRLAALAPIPLLAATEPVRQLGAALTDEGPIPATAEVDAYHIAVAAVNGMDYLLTWNCTHIANASMRSEIEDVCRSHGYEPPIICMPQELIGEYTDGT